MNELGNKISFSLDTWENIIKYQPTICKRIGNSKVIGIKYSSDMIYCSLIRKYSFSVVNKNKNPPDGIYTYILTKTDDNFILYIIEIMPDEIGSKHFCILSQIDDKKKIISAGEMLIKEQKIYYNFFSGSIMIDIEEYLSIKLDDNIENIRKTILIPLHNDVLSKMFNNTEIMYINKSFDKPVLSKDFLDDLCKEKSVKDKIRVFKDEKTCYKKFNDTSKYKMYC